MSNAPVQTTAPLARSRKRRLRRLVAGVVAAMALGVGVFAYLDYLHDRELRDAVAEADRLDPGWRMEEMEAARAAVPADENGATLVRAARALMPPIWLPPPASGGPPLDERLSGLAPQEPPNEADLKELRAELGKVAAALAKARELADRPQGRYPVTWSEDLIGTLTPHLDDVRTLGRMLALDALLRAHDGDIEGAVRSCRALLNTGRSVGDEPMPISQLVRAVGARDLVRALERALRAGAATPQSLEEMQRALALEAEEPLLLRVARGSRVCWDQPLELMRTGKFNFAPYKMRASMLGATGDELIARRQARACQAAYLRHSNAVVEIAKLPSRTQEERFRKLAMPTQRLPALIEGLSGQTDWVKLARTFHMAQARLRCAAAALATERFRLVERRWPDDLGALVPRYLDAVPSDPFDGQPLRRRRWADGLVIYSLGPDRIDDGGKLDRGQPGAPGTDVGFQLWDGERRAGNVKQ
jgi:hypothetical protein